MVIEPTFVGLPVTCRLSFTDTSHPNACVNHARDSPQPKPDLSLGLKIRATDTLLLIYIFRT